MMLLRNYSGRNLLRLRITQNVLQLSLFNIIIITIIILFIALFLDGLRKVFQRIS